MLNRNPDITEEMIQLYNVEKQMATKLRNASKSERLVLYKTLYDELFRLFPNHSLLKRKSEGTARNEEVQSTVKVLKKLGLTQPDFTFLEIGAGDCFLSFELSKYMKQVYALDVSEEVSRHRDAPENFKLIISDGCTIPIDNDTIDVAYSSNLMEHLHPDDAIDQLKNVLKSLKKGGAYYCLTPNRLNGPHDISKFFDQTATCFHLKEYTNGELAKIMRNAGFSKVRKLFVLKSFWKLLPVQTVSWIEWIISMLSYRIRKRIVTLKIIRRLIGVNLVAFK